MEPMISSTVESVTPPAGKYPLPIRILHWTMAVLILAMLALGLFMTSLPRDYPSRGDLYGLHKSLGVLVLALAAIRLTVRLNVTVPPLPDIIPLRDRAAARLSHYAFYVFFFALPLSGITMSQAGGHAVAFFGAPLPPFFAPDKALSGLANDAHEILAYCLIALIAVHMAGAAKHFLFERINLLRRMW